MRAPSRPFIRLPTVSTHKKDLLHTDRGAQYISQRFQTLLLRYGCKKSMSREENPYDNAVMESFYRTLNRELVQGLTMTILNKPVWVSLNH